MLFFVLVCSFFISLLIVVLSVFCYSPSRPIVLSLDASGSRERSFMMEKWSSVCSTLTVTVPAEMCQGRWWLRFQIRSSGVQTLDCSEPKNYNVKQYYVRLYAHSYQRWPHRERTPNFFAFLCYCICMNFLYDVFLM